MALNARPTLSSISAFDAEFGTLNKENIAAPILKFSWRDGVVKKNRVTIRDYDTNEYVYDCTIATMALKHKLHNKYDVSDKVQVVTYNLQNGHKYIANVYVCTTDEEWSLASNDIIFYCYSSPTFMFTNFNTYLGEGTETAVVDNSSVNLIVKYYQDNNEPLSSYKFELYDYNGVLLDSSNIKYSSLSEDVLHYTFGGVSETERDKHGNVQINRAYKVVCIGETQHGILVSIEQKFIVKLIASGVGSLVHAENVGDGTVSIYSNYKIMNVHCSTDEPVYVYDLNNNPYAIDLTNNEYVEFIDGFIMKHPYEFIFKGEFKVDKLISFETIEGYHGEISLKSISYTILPYYYFEFFIEKNNMTYSIRTNYFRKDTDLVKAEVDLSYYNGLYNIKAKIDTNGAKYIISYSKNGDVDIFFLTEYTMTSDDNGNITILNSDITVNSDGNGNITIS